jgi:hypothetical protein
MASKEYEQHQRDNARKLSEAFMRGARNVKDTKASDTKTTKKG